MCTQAPGWVLEVKLMKDTVPGALRCRQRYTLTNNYRVVRAAAEESKCAIKTQRARTSFQGERHGVYAQRHKDTEAGAKTEHLKNYIGFEGIGRGLER